MRIYYNVLRDYGFLQCEDGTWHRGDLAVRLHETAKFAFWHLFIGNLYTVADIGVSELAHTLSYH